MARDARGRFKKKSRRRYRKGSPPAGATGRFGEVVTVRYLHLGDGEYYEHEFRPGVFMAARSDGSLRIHKPGSTVWGDL